jgi:hypothetical protein
VPLAFDKVADPLVTTAVQLLIVVPVGAVSATVTLEASLGPLLVTVMLYATVVPGTKVLLLFVFTVTISETSLKFSIKESLTILLPHPALVPVTVIVKVTVPAVISAALGV